MNPNWIVLITEMNALKSIQKIEGSNKPMGNAIHDKKAQIEYLTNRLNLLLSVLDTISPEEADVEDIDRLLQMLEDLQSKINQFKTDW